MQTSEPSRLFATTTLLSELLTKNIPKFLLSEHVLPVTALKFEFSIWIPVDPLKVQVFPDIADENDPFVLIPLPRL